MKRLLLIILIAGLISLAACSENKGQNHVKTDAFFETGIKSEIKTDIFNNIYKWDRIYNDGPIITRYDNKSLLYSSNYNNFCIIDSQTGKPTGINSNTINKYDPPSILPTVFAGYLAYTTDSGDRMVYDLKNKNLIADIKFCPFKALIAGDTYITIADDIIDICDKENYLSLLKNPIEVPIGGFYIVKNNKKIINIKGIPQQKSETSTFIDYCYFYRDGIIYYDITNGNKSNIYAINTITGESKKLFSPDIFITKIYVDKSNQIYALGEEENKSKQEILKYDITGKQIAFYNKSKYVEYFYVTEKYIYAFCKDNADDISSVLYSMSLDGNNFKRICQDQIFGIPSIVDENIYFIGNGGIKRLNITTGEIIDFCQKLEDF